MQEPDYTIFISHAAVDEEIARAIKGYLGKAFPNQRVFVSSDPEDIRLGDEWVAKILKALETAKYVLVLTTQRGLTRKWVWFESGRTWYSNVKLIPCCIGDLQKGNLPSPFSTCMAVNIDDPRDVVALFELLRESFGTIDCVPDYEDIARTMIRLDVRADEKNKAIEDPYASTIAAEINRVMATLSLAERETLKQFAIYGELSTAGVKSLVKRTGVDMQRWSVPSSLIERTGWLVSNPGNKPYDDMQLNVYSVNSTVRPYLRAYFSSEQ